MYGLEEVMIPTVVAKGKDSALYSLNFKHDSTTNKTVTFSTQPSSLTLIVFEYQQSKISVTSLKERRHELMFMIANYDDLFSD